MERSIGLFKKLYKEVIDSSGNIKACGREKCIKLIEMAESINVNSDFGDKNTGHIKIDNIKDLYSKLT